MPRCTRGLAALLLCACLATSAAAAATYDACVKQHCGSIKIDSAAPVCGTDPSKRYPSHCHAACGGELVQFTCPAASKCSDIADCHECADQEDSASKVRPTHANVKRCAPPTVLWRPTCPTHT